MFPSNRQLSSSPRAVCRGFTLTELLVVVGIIIALVALLIPALSHVRKKGRDKEAESMLTGLAQALQTYHTTFGAYPGPMSPGATASVSTKGMSGAQNMLLGLSYTMYDSAQAPAGSLALGSGYSVDPTNAKGPVNLANRGPTGAYEQLNSFFTVTARNVSPPSPGVPPTWPAGGFPGIAPGAGNNFNFPVLVDTYPDALPILYYRRSPGVSMPVAADNNNAPAGYFLRDNLEYTNGKLTTANGTLYDQLAMNAAGAPSPGQALRSKDLQKYASDSGTPPNARGGFMLISAGADRLYGCGPDPESNSDNIVVVGGN